MKSKEALKLLNVSRQTLCNYVKLGKVLIKKLPSGLYDYDKELVFKLSNIDCKRVNVS